VVNPLKWSLKIELYNENYLREKGEKSKTYSKINDKPASLVDNLAFRPHPNTSYPSTGEMHQESDTTPETVEIFLSAELLPTGRIPSSSPTHLKEAIMKSANCLFFIAYTPSGTMTSRWYLVQANVESATSDLMSDLVEGEYYCTFLAKHPSDAKSSDDCSRYWPNWYRYSRDSLSDEIVFGYRILFFPNTMPNHNRYPMGGYDAASGRRLLVAQSVRFSIG